MTSSTSTCMRYEQQNRFWLVNNSGQPIQEAYVSSARTDNWGPDILGSSVLPAGNRVWVTPVFGDCVLNVRVVYASGQAEERRQVNACGISQIAFGRSGAGAGASVGGGGGAVVSPPGAGNPSFYLGEPDRPRRSSWRSMFRCPPRAAGAAIAWATRS